MIKVLFVCTGNICRSPTAEGVFRHLAREAGLENAFAVDSAGIEGFHAGEAPDSRAARAAQKHGVSLAGQAARRVQARDFHDFDYIFAMDRGHRDALSRLAPAGARARIAMFLENGDVPDPWYGDEEGFDRVFSLIHARARALVDMLGRGVAP